MRTLGIDATFGLLCVSTVLSAAAAYAAWLSAGLPFSEALHRFSVGLVAMLGYAIVFVPLVAPCMMMGWAVGWLVGGTLRLPIFSRALLAAVLLGGAAVLPFLYFLGRAGYAAENEWRIVVRPLLFIVPTVAVLAAAVLYRRR